MHEDSCSAHLPVTTGHARRAEAAAPTCIRPATARYERAPAKPARSRSDEAGWAPQPIGTVEGDECWRIDGDSRSGRHDERRHEVRRLVGLRTLAVVTRFARRAGAVLARRRAVAEPLAGSVLICLPGTTVAGHDDVMGGAHLCLATTHVREPRQPVAGQRQQCHEKGQ
jgi:hypothetical protein